MSTEIIRQRHAAYQTSEAQIFELVERATRHQPLSQEKIVRGYDSEVYRVRTDSGLEVVARIRHHGGVSYYQEAWAIEQSRKAGVPVPEILLLDIVAVGDQQREVMIQRSVPGRSLEDIQDGLEQAALAHIWEQAGAALGAIHSIPAGGFYRMRADGSWDFPNWSALVEAAIRDRTSEKPFIMQAGFTEAEVDRLLEAFANGLDRTANPQPVLCHGDFVPGHLFVDDTLTLTGVIDFGDFHGGGPMGDISNLQMSFPEIDLTWLQRGYPNQTLFGDGFAERLFHAKLSDQLGYLAHFVQQNNADEIGPLVRGLRESLRKIDTRRKTNDDGRMLVAR